MRQTSNRPMLMTKLFTKLVHDKCRRREFLETEKEQKYITLHIVHYTILNSNVI